MDSKLNKNQIQNNNPAKGEGEVLEPLPVWTCDLQEIEGVSKSPWTVGDKRLLNCRGDYVEKFKSPLFFEWPEKEQTYTLFVLEPSFIDHQHIQLVVTSYKPGQYEPKNFWITDGQNRVQVEGLSWQLESVTQASEEAAQPFPPFGPYYLQRPLWFWGIFIVVGLIVLWLVVRKVKRHTERKNFIQSLTEHSSALSPFNQLNKDFRQFGRKYGFSQRQKKSSSEVAQEYLKDLDSAWRLYLSRELQVPANQWSSRAVLQDIKKHHKKVFKEVGRDLKTILSELDRAQRSNQNLEMRDCEQLLEMSRDLANRIYQIQYSLKKNQKEKAW